MDKPSSEVLKVKNLTKRFGGLIANDGIDLTVYDGEIVGLIGPNGAGKTTLFNCIAGYYPIDEGTITFYGREIANLPPESVSRIGVARTFQLVKIFGGMSVLDNVMTGAFLRHPAASKARRLAGEMLDFVGLADKKTLVAGALTLPDKKKLEMARGLATEPKLLMLDEAVAGLNSTEVQKAIDLIAKIRNLGTALIVVEHVMEVIMPISDRVVVLDHGVKIAEDQPSLVARDPRVIEAYLGEKYVAQRR
jgi:branched-chain amino acid transport system ATP-binding protein